MMLSDWSLSPGIAVGIAVPAAVYAVGVGRVWRAAGRGRGIRVSQAVMFVLGIATLVLALLSPLEEVADELQSAHMIQHLLLILVVPPLFLFGEPVRALVWALPERLRLGPLAAWMQLPFWRHAAAFFTAPPMAFALHAVALLVWHMPAPYDAALRSESIHAIEHLSFLGTALLFWWVVLAPPPFRRLPIGLRVPYVVAMSLVGAAIGVVLTFASTPFYEAYVRTAPLWGLTALEDQQLAGLIMWIPGGIAYLIAAAALFVNWINGTDARTRPRSAVAVRTETA